MATKGYSSYHGRGSPGKIALIVVLVLILLGAITYLVVQNYLVYDESGQVHLELPFFKPKDGVDTEQSGDGGFTDEQDLRVLPAYAEDHVGAGIRQGTGVTAETFRAQGFPFAHSRFLSFLLHSLTAAWTAATFRCRS